MDFSLQKFYIVHDPIFNYVGVNKLHHRNTSWRLLQKIGAQLLRIYYSLCISELQCFGDSTHIYHMPTAMENY